MADTTRVYAGTVGQSIWRSDDGGLTFTRASSGAPSESDVRALALHPDDARVLFLGIETGLFVSRDAAGSWERVVSPLDGRQVWCLTFDPRDPNVMYAGTCPADVFRSGDGGRSWELLDTRIPRECVGGAPLTPRVTCIHVDRRDGVIFAGVEIAGVHRSPDGGRTWQALGEGLSSQDIHGLVPVWNGGRTLLATTNNDVNRSTDDGASWLPLGVKQHFPWSYTRACALPPGDPGAVWVGAGNGPPGSEGGLFRTRDLGRSWERLPLPGTANSTIWNLAFNPADPRRAYAGSISGQLYRTLDGGDSWSKLPMEFGEVRALAWSPRP